jgi:hypothetical protein
LTNFHVVLVLAMGLLSQASPTHARSVTLMWDANTEVDLAGYKVYYRGLSPQTGTNVLDVGNSTIAVISNLVQGFTYSFAVTAYNDSGQESDFSTEVVYTFPAASHLPPTLNPLGNVTLNLLPLGHYGEGYAVPLSGITASGGAPAKGTTLTVKAVSSNPAIIPDPVVNYLSPNSAGVLKLNPRGAGSATITVVASDGVSYTERSFVVTIKVCYDPFKVNVAHGLSGEPSVTLTWESQPGLIYRVLATPELNSQIAPVNSRSARWVDVSGFIVATGTNTYWTDSRSSALDPRPPLRFYLVELLNGPFRVTPLGRGPTGEWVVSWESRPGLNYRVLWNAQPATLDTQLSTWLDVSGVVTATGTTTSWTDAQSSRLARPPWGFYAVELLAPR